MSNINEGGVVERGNSVPKYGEDATASAEPREDDRFESAENEKKRLERQEAERLRKARAKEEEASKWEDGLSGEDVSTPPPYSDFGRST